MSEMPGNKNISGLNHVFNLLLSVKRLLPDNLKILNISRVYEK